ncbi:uncharacterized protein BYT42DRAFT_570869 [Radiomyces spectabilis]|uniref:uncharacterized protein n=1 Tax=Radiomyces spectabilis TaxID=64574 RepID=UPI00222009C9|nr:uncharacterized protein BYT42DRAFT_570869 [Radiomyces spectabilis]KAI8377589.1 hypothetical protein BYT42DRAFT_570869 [Radiomyces spectabilis]
MLQGGSQYFKNGANASDNYVTHGKTSCATPCTRSCWSFGGGVFLYVYSIKLMKPRLQAVCIYAKPTSRAPRDIVPRNTPLAHITILCGCEAKKDTVAASSGFSDIRLVVPFLVSPAFHHGLHQPTISGLLHKVISSLEVVRMDRQGTGFKRGPFP